MNVRAKRAIDDTLFFFFFFLLDNERLARAWAATYRGVKELQNVLRVGKTNEKKGRYHGHRTRVCGQKTKARAQHCASNRFSSNCLRTAIFLLLRARSRASPSARVKAIRRDLRSRSGTERRPAFPSPAPSRLDRHGDPASAPRNVPHAITETIDVDTH